MPGAYDQAYGAPQPVQPQSPMQQPPVQQPAPAPQQPPAQQMDGQKQHVHHSYIWLGTIRSLVAVVFVLFVTSFSSIASLIEMGDLSLMAAGGAILGGAGVLVLALIAVVVLIYWLSYKHLYYVMGPNEFSLYSGIITKKRVHVPYDRVQSVDARASLLQRVFGVRSVFIDTAGGASNKAVIVPYLAKAQADQLTAELYARKQQALQPAAVQAAPAQPGTAAAAAPMQPAVAQTAPSQPVFAQGNILDVGAQAWSEAGGVFAGQPLVQEMPSFEYGLSNKELFFAGLSNSTSFALLVVAFIGIVCQVLDLMFEVFPSQTNAVFGSLETQAADPLFLMGAVFTIGALIVFLAIIWVLSAAGNCIGYGGFRARRIGDRIEVERGLLQHQRQSISIERVQAVVVKQSFIRRLIGYCEVSLDKIDALVGDEAKQKNGLNASGVVVHPFCKLADVPGILGGLVPEYAGIPQGRAPLPKVSHRRAITRRCFVQGGGFWTALVVAVVQIISNAVLDPAAASTAYEAMENATILGYVNPICIVLYGIALVVFALDLIAAIKWARESGFAANERFMKVVNGGLAREERSFPRNKIQYGFTQTNPLQRMARVATINARTAAGVGGTTIQLKDAAVEDAEAWLAWLQPRSRNLS